MFQLQFLMTTGKGYPLQFKTKFDWWLAGICLARTFNGLVFMTYAATLNGVINATKDPFMINLPILISLPNLLNDCGFPLTVEVVSREKLWFCAALSP